MTGIDRARRCAIAVMAKAPVPGRAKTRLVPPLTPLEAAELSACFLSDVTTNIAAAARRAAIDGWIAYAPADAAGRFDGLLAPGTGLVLADGAIPVPDGIAGFGRSLWHAATALLSRGYGAVCLLNSDSPSLPTRCLVDAATGLLEARADTVLGAADDGGYYLLGLRAATPALFEGVSWSTAAVADQTRAGAARAGLTMIELPAWYDVDDAAALRMLVDERPDHDAADGGSYAAPATRGWLARHAIATRLAGAPVAGLPA